MNSFLMQKNVCCVGDQFIWVFCPKIGNSGCASTPSGIIVKCDIFVKCVPPEDFVRSKSPPGCAFDLDHRESGSALDLTKKWFASLES